MAVARSPLHTRPSAALDHRSLRRRGPADAQRRWHRRGHVQRRDLQPSGHPCRVGEARQVRVDDRPFGYRSAPSRLRGMGTGMRPPLLWHVRVRRLRRARSRAPGDAPRSRSRRHQADVFCADLGRRVVVRVRNQGAAGASVALAGDGSRRLLALPDVHRDAGADDAVPRHLQAAGGSLADDRSHRRCAGDGLLGLCAPPRGHLARIRSQRRRGGRSAARAAAHIDRAADGVGCAVRRAAVGRRRFLTERRADGRADGPSGLDIHRRLRGQGGLQRIRARAARQPALRDRPSRDRDHARRDAGVSAGARPRPGRTDCRQRLHPALLSRAAGQEEWNDGRAGRRRRGREFPRLLVVRALPAEGRVRLSAGTGCRRLVEASIQPPLIPPRHGRGSRHRLPREDGAATVLGRRHLLVGGDAAAAHARCRAVPHVGRLSGARSPAGVLHAMRTATRSWRVISHRSTAGSRRRRSSRKFRTWK